MVAVFVAMMLMSDSLRCGWVVAGGNRGIGRIRLLRDGLGSATEHFEQLGSQPITALQFDRLGQIAVSSIPVAKVSVVVTAIIVESVAPVAT